MEDQRATGRGLVLAVIVATLALSALAIITSNVVRGSERLPTQIVRFLLTVGLCVFLHRGANWARWVAGVLFILAGLAGLVGGAALVTLSPLGFVVIAMGLVYLASAYILLFVPAVREYFTAKKTSAV